VVGYFLLMMNVDASHNAAHKMLLDSRSCSVNIFGKGISFTCVCKDGMKQVIYLLLSNTLTYKFHFTCGSLLSFFLCLKFHKRLVRKINNNNNNNLLLLD
jgi:hypothetical protein